MHQFKLVLIIAFILTLSGCDNARKNAPNVLALRDISGFRVNKIIWGPEYSYWNPIICFSGDCPTRKWEWCVELQASNKGDALKGFKYMYSQRLETITPRWYKFITKPSSDPFQESQRLDFLKQYETNRKLYEHDFGIYLYKLAEAKTAEETKNIEDEIVLKLMSGVIMKVEYRRGAKRSQWFYGLSRLEYGKRPCQSF